MMKDDSFTDLFVHYINRYQSKARFRGVYASLFNGIVKYLSSCLLNEEESIKKCLKILAAKWSYIPEEKDLTCLQRFISIDFKNPQIREMTLYVLLNLFPMNESARRMFDDVLNINDLTVRI